MDYLAKVPEVKDTVHKHSLLHHLCHMIMEQNVDTTDLYSEIGAATRASRVDYDKLAANLNKMEEDCKASWDHLRAIAKHDGNTAMKIKYTISRLSYLFELFSLHFPFIFLSKDVGISN